jgi:hypothetical protein
VGVALYAFLFAAPAAWAEFTQIFENPGEGQEVSGITAISGWVFSTTGNPVTVQLFIDSVPAEMIPCCGPRPDVPAQVPGAPANTGFGLLRNYGRLSPGMHTIGVQFSASGETPLLVNHDVMVVKPGGRSGEDPEVFFSFLSDLNVDGANVAVDSDAGELIVAPVTVQDRGGPAGSGLTRQSTLRLRWERSLQSFVIVSAASDTSFSDVQQIFTNSCAVSGGCHDSAFHTQNLNLSAGNAFKSIVGVGSVEDPTRFRINPGDFVASYLYQKIISGGTISGARMPLIGGPLTDEQINTIKNWIIAGAPPPQP